MPRFLTALLLSVAVLTQLSAQSAEPAILTEDYGTPGTIMPVAITGRGIADASVALVDSRGRSVSRASGFAWSVDGEKMVVALVGVPSTAVPGRYRLSVTAKQGRSDLVLEKSVVVSEIPFDTEIIPLDDSMSDLYEDDSERKADEARYFWSVISSFRPEARYHEGALQVPIDDFIPTAGYGDRRRYRMPDGSETPSIHNGRDLWAPTGTAVAAGGKGRVVMARSRMVTGNTVILEHLPGVYSLYYHLDTLSVEEGVVVRAGQEIGTVGSSGLVTGEHLHWELRTGGIPVDPWQYMDRSLLDTTRFSDMMVGSLQEGG